LTHFRLGEGKLLKRIVYGIMLALLLASMLGLTFNFQSVKAAGPPPVVSLNPLDSIVLLGDSFTINVTVTNVTDLGAWEFKLNYNTTILDAISVSPTPYTANNTDWLPIDANSTWAPINDTIGRVWAGALIPVFPGHGLNGSFPLVTINFTATATGDCTLDLYKTVLGTSWGLPIAHTTIDGSVTVRVTPDTTPPTWSNAGTNNTIAEQPTLFYVKWTDDVRLGGFVFGTNNTGTWANDTWTPMSGTTDWSNVTKILTSSPGVVVQWRVWANDTSNNWNYTGTLSLITLQPPHAEFTYSPLTPYIDETVTFNASVSYDPDGTIVSYFWDFGDGTNATGMIVAHAYTTIGNYTVTLLVTDNDGLTDNATAVITVLSVVETMVFFNINPNPATVGQKVTLKGILVDEFSQRLSSETVRLYARPLAGSWKYITSLTTNGRGIFNWQATIPVTGTFVFAVYYPGSETYESTYSLAVLIVQ